MPEPSVRVVTDSTAYLSSDLVSRYGIEVVSLHVVVGGTDHVEGQDISADDVAKALRDYTIVTTSRPSPQTFAEAYARLAQDGATGIVSVHLSGQMSGTVEAAQLAAADAPVPVRVIDSQTIGMAMGYAVIAAAEAAAEGADVDEVAQVAAARLGDSTVLFYVHNLEHLRRGGRIGAASALFGSALSIKPILAVREGRIAPVEKVRTSAKAIARMLAMALDHVEEVGADDVDVAVHHLDAAERAESVAEQLGNLLPGAREVRIVELGAVVGAHVGPGTVAIAVSPVIQPVESPESRKQPR